TCTIANMAEPGGVVSSIASLNVNDPPVITSHPASLTRDPIPPNNTAAFMVVAEGAEPLAYQWMKNGVNIPDATLSTHVINGVAETDQGVYTCFVSNSAGTKSNANVTSNPATLSVNDPPVITLPPDDATVVPGETVTFTITASGSPTLSYRWRKGATDLADTPGKYSGTDTPVLNVLDAAQADEGMYSCVVSNTAGTAQSPAALLFVKDPVTFTTHPVSTTRDYSKSVTFTVSVIGTIPFTYRWTKDGNALSDSAEISGSQTDTLTITSLTNLDEGAYVCEVTNDVGMNASNPAVLTVNDPAILVQPESKVILPGGSGVIFSLTAAGSGTVEFQWQKFNGTNWDNLSDDAKFSGTTTAALSITDAVKDPDEGTYRCVVRGADGYIPSNPVMLTVSDPAIVSNPQSQTVDPGSQVVFTVVVDPGSSDYPNGISYRWQRQVGASWVDIPGALAYSYTIPVVAESDEGYYRCHVSNSVGEVDTNPAFLSVNDPPIIDRVTVTPESGFVEIGQSVEFTVIMASGTDNPFKYQWYKGVNALMNGGRITGAKARKLTINDARVSDEGKYWCYVTNTTPYSASSEQVDLFVGSARLAFTANPQNIKRYVGDRARFSVTTTGGRPPFSYQWWFDNGAKAIVRVGGNTSIFLNTGVIEADAGEYWCDVTDLRATYSSGHGRLDVAQPVTITSQPQSGTRTQGESYTFSVSAMGGFPPLGYAWKKQGVSGTIGTDQSLWLNMLQLSDAGVYHAEVSDSNTTVIVSNTASLTVNETSQPGLPLLGVMGLGLLAGALAMGGATVVRRRK
ncbi:MAG TPA: immunoglobulin domain-containing protein, partial [Candidatus Hydrogenedentes bacterium]|nr:immunoglobulin domain-containing protein [Candidatus Hydrogenedentota bacterium]